MKPIALLLALAACTQAQRTTALGISSSALLVADWHQTHAIVAKCVELNPIIGPCGERVSADTYFPIAIAAHLAIGLLLPDYWRDTWFAAVAGAQGSTVWANAVME